MFESVELLARMQFAFTIMFHYLFPPLSIGLGTILVIMEGMYLKTKNPIYESMCKFWVKIFALNFSLGVATGVVMQAEFGTNWATYSRYVGDIFGSALAAEGIFAFFLESGFLAVLLFGWNRVSPKMHFFATLMVCTGATFSAFWIVVANSWMHTPVGYEIVGEGMNARAVINDFWAMVFNPSAMTRFTHVVIGAWLTGAFFVMSVSAYYLLKRRHLDFAKKSFCIALAVAAIAAPLQAVVGSHSAEIVAKYQPAKLAVLEGHFETGSNAPFWIIGLPDEQSGTIKYGIKVPGLLSLLTHGSTDAVVVGLNDFAKEDRPPMAIPFFAYRGMIALGLWMIGISWLAVYLAWRKRLFENKWMLRLFVVSVAAPYLANQFGWIACEVGRQPWIVQGLLRTFQALSKAVSAEHIVASLIMFAVIYVFLGAVFFYTLNRKIQHGPDLPAPPVPPGDGNGSGKTTVSGLRDAHRDRLDPSHHPEAGSDGKDPGTSDGKKPGTSDGSDNGRDK